MTPVTEQEKRCRRCEGVKPLEEFYRDKSAKDGRQSWCKECQGPSRQRNQEAVARYRREWNRKNRDAVLRHVERWKEANPEKVEAHLAVRKALRGGTLVRPDSCEGCDEGGRIEAHHDDYSKPLEVRWLCHDCHVQHHHSAENTDAE